MALRFRSYLRWVVISLGIILLVGAVASTTLIATEYRATYYAQPVDSGDVHSSVNVRDLPIECQPIAHQLSAGQTVFEAGYEFRSGERTVIRQTNLSGNWRLSTTVCGTHLFTGGALRIDGQYYQIRGTERHGTFWYRHNILLSLSALTGVTLIIISIGLGGNQEREE